MEWEQMLREKGSVSCFELSAKVEAWNDSRYLERVSVSCFGHSTKIETWNKSNETRCSERGRLFCYITNCIMRTFKKSVYITGSMRPGASREYFPPLPVNHDAYI